MSCTTFLPDGVLWTTGSGLYGKLGHHGTENRPIFSPSMAYHLWARWPCACTVASYWPERAMWVFASGRHCFWHSGFIRFLVSEKWSWKGTWCRSLKWWDFLLGGRPFPILSPDIRNAKIMINQIYFRIIFIVYRSMTFSDWRLRHLLWKCPNINVTGLHWWSVDIGSGNGLVPLANKPLPEPMLTQISVAIWGWGWGLGVVGGGLGVGCGGCGCVWGGGGWGGGGGCVCVWVGGWGVAAAFPH